MTIKQLSLSMKNLTNLTNKFHLIIQTNSPGELTTWVAPIIKYCKQEYKDIFITLCLVPCQYASGNEKQVAEKMNEIDQIFLPNETVKLCFKLKKFIKRSSSGAILCLGGDPFYTQLLKLISGYKTYVYTEHKHKPGLLIDHVFYKHKIGDLMQTKIEQFTTTKNEIFQKHKLEKKEYLLFLPGSRPKHFNVFSKFCLEVSQKILAIDNKQEVIINVAPTITENDYKKLAALNTSNKIHIISGNCLELMKISKLMISLPGTNTAEAMYMNLPMITILPFNNLNLADIDGLAGLILKIPIIGPYLKKVIFPILIKRIKYVSLPNKITQSNIVPEIKKTISSELISNEVINLIKNKSKLQEIKLNLEKINHKKNVEKEIINFIFNNN